MTAFAAPSDLPIPDGLAELAAGLATDLERLGFPRKD